MLTIEGLEIQTNITALQDGFLVVVTTRWDLPPQHKNVFRVAQREGLVGRIVNTHEGSYADAEKTVVKAVTDWENRVKVFIQKQNQS